MISNTCSLAWVQDIWTSNMVVDMKVRNHREHYCLLMQVEQHVTKPQEKAKIVILHTSGLSQWPTAEDFHCRRHNRQQIGQRSVCTFIRDFSRPGVFETNQKQENFNRWWKQNAFPCQDRSKSTRSVIKYFIWNCTSKDMRTPNKTRSQISPVRDTFCRRITWRCYESSS